MKTLKNKNILIAEDDDFNFVVLSEILFDTKANCIRAIDGIDAIEKFNNQNIDLIFMDINMPRLDGISAIKKIRETNNKVPIIVLTAFAYNEKLQREKGFNEFIIKPFDSELVCNLVFKYL